MNKTELLAYEELKRRYGNDGVTRINRRGHPDFICGEDRYEVKKASEDKLSSERMAHITNYTQGVARRGWARQGWARHGSATQGKDSRGKAPALYSIFTNLSQIILAVWYGTVRLG